MSLVLLAKNEDENGVLESRFLLPDTLINDQPAHNAVIREEGWILFA
jgi:hypothetical protein